jgi:hypothetical protein
MTNQEPLEDRARNRRANAWSEAGFASIQRRYRVALEREDRYREQVLLEKYRQTRPPSTWLPVASARDSRASRAPRTGRSTR